MQSEGSADDLSRHDGFESEERTDFSKEEPTDMSSEIFLDDDSLNSDGLFSSEEEDFTDEDYGDDEFDEEDFDEDDEDDDEDEEDEEDEDPSTKIDYDAEDQEGYSEDSMFWFKATFSTILVGITGGFLSIFIFYD
eukprot:gene2596-3350_t